MSSDFIAIRAVGETEDAWVYEGLAIPYGGPAGGQDLTGTHFTKSTDLCLDWFPNGGRPVLYGHGFDPELGTEVVGRDLAVRESPEGKWLQFQIDKAKRYAAEIKELADAGVLALSSAAVDHLTTIAAKSGEITRWPWVETSLVPNPANPEALIRTVKSADAAAHLAVVGTTVKELEVEINVAPEAEPAEAEEPDPAEHAKAGTHILECLADLISEESDEPDQVAILQRAVSAVQEWIAVEIGEIASGEELAEVEGDDALDPVTTEAPAMREGRRNNASDLASIQAIHDASASLGADCLGAGKAVGTPPATVLAVKAGDAVEMVPVADLDAVRSSAVELAIREAMAILGR